MQAARRTSPSIPRISPDQIPADPVQSARAAGLRYVTDQEPGIRRKRVGRHFTYLGVDGRPVRDPEQLRRIKALAIPPAWTDVWICPRPQGHVQATGRDARGRKQYRYHPRWREVRDETKYYQMVRFARALPGIRDRVEHDLGLPGLPREKVLATIVRLLEATLIRVGNETYARENHHYGLTTLRTRHVDIEGSTLRFRFRGKSGIKHDVGLRDRRVAGIIRRLRDLPGQHLFQYVNDHGELQDVDSADVNDYLREITGEDFTAKDFRTWAGTILAAQALDELDRVDSPTEARKNIVRAIETVATQLGNTPAVCRKCYVHPEILNAYLDGTTLRTIRERIQQELCAAPSDLGPEEAAVMALLQQRQMREADGRAAS